MKKHRFLEFVFYEIIIHSQSNLHIILQLQNLFRNVFYPGLGLYVCDVQSKTTVMYNRTFTM